MQTRQRTCHSRATIGDNRRLSFYAALFNAETSVYDFKPGSTERTSYREVIRPGAFTAALAGQGEVIACVDHDAVRTFAARSKGELLLQEDKNGLYASCWLTDDVLGNQVKSDVESGKLDATSFRFGPISERWDGDFCELLSVELADVTLTNRPAYPQTKGEVHLRTKDRLRELFARMKFVNVKLKLKS